MKETIHSGNAETCDCSNACGTPAARYPLACGRHYAATGITRTDAEILQLPAKLMSLALQKRRPVTINPFGLNGTRKLVTSLTLGRLFKPANPKLGRWLTRIWQESVRISSFSYVLARYLPNVDVEQALLAGLMSHVGTLPFLYFAADFPSDRLGDEIIRAAITVVRGPLGQALLQAWEFPPDFCEVPLHCQDWYYDAGGPLSLSDVVTLASWHAQLGHGQALPPIETLPSFQKLDLREISPTFSLGLLHNAREHLAQIRTLLQL